MFPKPMPVRHDAILFPRLFTTDESLDLPYVPYDPEIAPLGENRSFISKGSLCFEVSTHTNSSCIGLISLMVGQVKVWQATTGRTEVWSDAIWIQGFAPDRGVDELPISRKRRLLTQPKWAPFCLSSRGRTSWPWSGCQSPEVV